MKKITALPYEISSWKKTKKWNKRHSNRCEFARKWIGVAIVVGSIIGYLITK